MKIANKINISLFCIAFILACISASIFYTIAKSDLQIRIVFIVLLLAGPFATWLAGFFVTRMLTMPLRKLHKGMEIVGKGDLDYKVGTTKKDEIGELSRAFDEMVRNLKLSTASIEQLHKEIIVRKNTQERLRKSEAWLSTTLRSIGDGVIATDVNGYVVFINNVAQGLTGYSREEAHGKHLKEIFNIINEITGKEANNPLEKVLREGIIAGLSNHTILVSKNGAKYPIDDSAAPIQDETGNIMGAVLVFRDITERKKMEEKLTATAKEWEITFDSISDLVSIQDRDSVLVKVNKAYASLFKRKPQEIIGKRCYSIVHGTFEPCLDCPHQNTMLTKKASRLEYFEKRFNAYFEVSVSPIFDANNEVTGTVHIIKDITERKKVEHALKEASESKAYFTSMVSHELRTPLTAIKESISIVMDKTAGPLNNEQRDFLDISKRNVDRLARLINDVLDYQKLESGKFEFNIQENDVNEIIKEVGNAMISVAKNKGIDIVLDLDENLPKLKCDRDKIVQVFSNLISNAIKFTEKGSITVGSKRQDNTIEVMVKDTGIGIKTEDLPRLFRAFEQLEKGNARKTGSTGLGLAISKEIIEKHKGKIYAESEFGKGSKFHIILPIIERRA